MVLGIEMDGLREEVDGRVPLFGRKRFVPLGFQQLWPGLRQLRILRTTVARTSAMVDGDGDGDGGGHAEVLHSIRIEETSRISWNGHLSRRAHRWLQMIPWISFWVFVCSHYVLWWTVCWRVHRDVTPSSPQVMSVRRLKILNATLNPYDAV